MGWDGDNSSGFSALPGGGRYSNGEFRDIDNWGNWWSSDEASDYKHKCYSCGVWYRRLASNHLPARHNVIRSGDWTGPKHDGYSVRCIKDISFEK